jgi:PIN domain nuclease of toxin-antitoxin system
LSHTLLDTQAMLWFIDGSSKLSNPALACIATPGIELYFSHASVWEIVIKHGIGKLPLPEPPEAFLTAQLAINKIRLLPISIQSIYAVGRLPTHHKDPFDRLIAAQCLRHDLELVSADAVFDAYGVRRIW